MKLKIKILCMIFMLIFVLRPMTDVVSYASSDYSTNEKEEEERERERQKQDQEQKERDFNVGVNISANFSLVCVSPCFYIVKASMCSSERF